MSTCNNKDLKLFPDCIRGDGFGVPINEDGAFAYSPFKMVFSNVDLTGARIRIAFKSSKTSTAIDLLLDSQDGTIEILDEHNIQIPVFKLELNEARYSIEMQFEAPGQEPITRKNMYMIVTNDAITG